MRQTTALALSQCNSALAVSGSKSAYNLLAPSGSANAFKDNSNSGPDERRWEQVSLDLDEQLSHPLHLYQQINENSSETPVFQHRTHGNKVVVKLRPLTPGLTAQDIAKTVKQVLQVRRLDHPNIAQVHDVLCVRSQLCVISEYCKGRSALSFVRRHGPMKSAQVTDVAVQLCNLLRFCHSAGVFHNNLKPQNILFYSRERKTVKVTDFAVSLAKEPASADVQGLGRVVFFLVTGKETFEGQALNQMPGPWREFVKHTLTATLAEQWTLRQALNYLLAHSRSLLN